MSKELVAFIRDESGLSLIEYGVTAVLVSLAGLPFWKLMGGELFNLYSGLDNAVESVNGDL